MAESVTKQDVQEIVGATVDKAVADLSGIIADFAQQVDNRFNQTEARLDSMGRRFDAMDRRLDAMDQRLFALENRLDTVEQRLDGWDRKFDHLLNTMDTFIARIERSEHEQLARDGQFQRLLEWARKVSEKTGIPLENL